MSRRPSSIANPEGPPEHDHSLIVDHVFTAHGDNRYSLALEPAGILFSVDRLRRSSHELLGELRVTVNGSCPHAKTVDGVLSVGDFNFSAVQSRTTRANLLQNRSGASGLDWFGFLEEFSVKILSAERQGEPAIQLADYQPEKPTGDDLSWEFEGLPILRRHPTVLFGKGASGKSYLAMWIAGRLAEYDVQVAYLDWELDLADHYDRLSRLFQPLPRNIHYINCKHPLRESMDRLKRLILQHRCTFAIFDSVGPASRARGGNYPDGDLGQEYFGLVRSFGVGSLHIAHPPKHVDDEKDATIYGSAFFQYLARSIWFVQPADSKPGELTMGLFHQKHTTGAKLEPRAFKLVFDGHRTRIERTNLKAVDELVAKLPPLDRLLEALKAGAKTYKQLATDLDLSQATLRQTVSRHKSKFQKLDKNTVGLAVQEDVF